MLQNLRGLYVIFDPAVAPGGDEVQIARAALDGGARLIQLRDKTREKGLQLPVAEALQALCRERGALFIVNDHVDLALAADADGVHLGQKDMPIDEARPIVGPDRIIGVSTNNVQEALAAQEAGADYVAVGSIFPTATKLDTRSANLERLRQVEIAVHVPVVAIGGINASNISAVVDAGAQAAAVISAVCGAEDPAAAARELSAAFGAVRRFGNR